MKFSIRTVGKRSPRLGVLKNIENRPEVQIETPMVLLHTQGGHIPHVAHEVFKLVSTEPQILQIPLVSMHCFQETFEYYDGSISEFIGSKNSLTCITLHDPSNLTKQGHHIKDQVPIWTKHGKVLYSSEMYMNMIEEFKPDMYYLLSDGDTNTASSQKRITKAIENTIKFNKECLERHKKSDVLKDKFVMGAIAGGYCLKAREKCIKALLEDKDLLNGFLIDGLHNNGPEVEFMPFDEIKGVVEFVIKQLPEEKLCSVQGCWNPPNIIKLIRLGVDVFDTSYCRILTERSSTLTFNIETNENNENYEINLRDIKYSEDFNPILETCECLACKKYTRAYIHHLLSVQELLAPVLIMIHNIHHYLRFFKKIRQSIANDTLAKFEEQISEEYKNHQAKILTKSNIESRNEIFTSVEG
ncbi:queuine tRNA-ribosyltransferase accessory subunit 2 [Diabrotica undecimpunctata]|uniref:queuine tRNA-ribosyltransferase accessory subunit 2 n=1 Tax=Diabrotica undecimpunctata TaxID=50387 RepID=UPI003B637E4D